MLLQSAARLQAAIYCRDLVQAERDRQAGRNAACDRTQAERSLTVTEISAVIGFALTTATSERTLWHR
jgi:hypothetical protein